jgi:FAD synthase
MAKYWFIEQDERWENGTFIRTTTQKPIEPQEAELIRQALELKEVARAQQKLLEPYRNQIKVVNVPVRHK